MRTPRPTVAGLMTFVLAVAIGLASIRSSSSFWASVELTTILALLFVATLCIICQRGEHRVFWVGFATFGWGYMLVAFGPWFHTEIEPHLLTTRLCSELYPLIHPKPVKARSLVEDMDLYSYSYRQYDTDILWYRYLANFVRIGHSLCAQLLAVIGGFLACHFATGSRRDSE